MYNEVYYWFFTLEYGLISMIQHLLQLASFLSALFTYFSHTCIQQESKDKYSHSKARFQFTRI